MKKSLDWIQDFRYKLQPQLKELRSSFMLYYGTRNWEHSLIRAIAWQPLCLKLAIATLDDTVNVFHCGQKTPATILRVSTSFLFCTIYFGANRLIFILFIFEYGYHI